MIPHRLKLEKILSAIAVLSVIFFSLLLIFTKTATWATLRPSIINLGFILTTTSLCWFFFEKIGWRMRIFRIGGWLCDIPDLGGRWEGELERKGENNPHTFILEIHQTLTHLQCYTYSALGESESFTAGLVTDQNKDQFKLVYSWIGRGGPLKKRESGLFYGTTILNYVERPQKVLVGIYYTDRAPSQTKGTIKVTCVSRECCRQFEQK